MTFIDPHVNGLASNAAQKEWIFRMKQLVLDFLEFYSAFALL